MTLFALLCYLVAFVCFVIAAFGLVKNVRGRTPNFVALGLAAWVLVNLVAAVRAWG